MKFEKIILFFLKIFPKLIKILEIFLQDLNAYVIIYDLSETNNFCIIKSKKVINLRKLKKKSGLFKIFPKLIKKFDKLLEKLNLFVIVYDLSKTNNFVLLKVTTL